MMQLVCNGVRLDLYEDTGLQFTHTNPAFAFGEMSAERTTQFKIPATPKNDRAFELAHIPAYSGARMRESVSATLMAGAIVMNGFLYISKFDGKDYNVVFVGGLAYDIKNFGGYQYGSIIGAGAYIPLRMYDANEGSIPMVAVVKYRGMDNAWYKNRVSVDLEQLFTQLNAQGIFKINGLTGSHIRVLGRKYEDDDFDFINAAEVIINDQQQATETDLGLDLGNGLLQIIDARVYIYQYDPDPSSYDQLTTKMITSSGRQYSITFPENTPANLCLCTPKWNGPVQVGVPQAAEVDFIGTRYFEMENGQVVYKGEPLAGKTITIGAPFAPMTHEGAFYDGSKWYFQDGHTGEKGDMSAVPSYNLQVRVEGEFLHTIYGFLQTLSFGELLKIYSACTGKLINVQKDGGVEFIDALDLSEEPLKQIIAQKDVTRTFGDYAQLNIVQFDEGDEVPVEQQLSVGYTIYNKNIEESKELLKLKATAGKLYEDDADANIFELSAEADEEKIAVALSDTGTEYMQRVTLIKSDLLQALCDSSTSVDVECWMSMLQYNSIDSSTGFVYNGTLYTWTKRQWQNEIAKLTLARV